MGAGGGHHPVINLRTCDLLKFGWLISLFKFLSICFPLRKEKSRSRFSNHQVLSAQKLLRRNRVLGLGRGEEKMKGRQRETCSINSAGWSASTSCLISTNRSWWTVDAFTCSTSSTTKPALYLQAGAIKRGETGPVMRQWWLNDRIGRRRVQLEGLNFYTFEVKLSGGNWFGNCAINSIACRLGCRLNFQRLMIQVLKGHLWTECLCYLDYPSLQPYLKPVLLYTTKSVASVQDGSIFYDGGLGH